MKDNLIIVRRMEGVNIYLKMVLFIKVIFKMIKLMVLDKFNIKTVIFMKESLNKI